jgi:flagellar biosynthesis/type III secretory pathway M-ring protein FliF/YscJ
MAIAIFVIVWSNEPERRPLIQNIKLVDAVKIIDALEASKIPYVTRLDSQMILVNDEDMDMARVALARIGIVIDYPEVKQMANAGEACDVLETKIYEYANNPNIPITEKPYFLKLVKLMMGAIVIIVLILSIVRPALKVLIYGKLEDENEP